MARTGGDEELPSVAELVNLSETKPLVIRGELDAKLAEEPEPKLDPLAILDAELAAEEPEERPQEAPPADGSRRAKPYVLAAGALAALGLAAVVLVQPHQVAGTAVPPPGAPTAAPAPPPTSSDAVETMSATQAPPPLTAQVRHSAEPTTSAPAAAGRKPAGPDATTSQPESPEDQWRDYVSSVISSWQQRPGHGGGWNR
ncbi:hypothetical protein ABJI51_23295 [Amycolatopsis sp. NEAU-NG30]|uniref:Uncharacterized protein n=1 Tax=Amycolatopsis melonis TaxID=3156488 RepID=A0ABV0LIA1_9PSEU